MTDQRALVVGVDGSLGSDIAQRWAVDEARARKLPIRLICAYTWNVEVASVPVYIYEPAASNQELKRVAETTLNTALQQVAAIAEGLDFSGEAIQGGAVDVLLQQAETAPLIVVGSRQLHATGSFVLGSVSSHVAARAACPVVVTRGPAGYPAERSKVIAAVDATAQSEAVLAFAFGEASRRGVALHAVFCWHPSVLHLQHWVERAADRGREQAERWLAETMAGWRENYPDVDVTSRVIDQHPVNGLVEESLAEQLLVVGKRGLGPKAGTLLGSVSQGVLHHASCPVAVVPTVGGENGG